MGGGFNPIYSYPQTQISVCLGGKNGVGPSKSNNEQVVLTVQPAGIGCTDEELWSVSVGSSVSHGQAAFTY